MIDILVMMSQSGPAPGCRRRPCQLPASSRLDTGGHRLRPGAIASWWAKPLSCNDVRQQATEGDGAGTTSAPILRMAPHEFSGTPHPFTEPAPGRPVGSPRRADRQRQHPDQPLVIASEKLPLNCSGLPLQALLRHPPPDTEFPSKGRRLNPPPNSSRGATPVRVINSIGHPAVSHVRSR